MKNKKEKKKLPYPLMNGSIVIAIDVFQVLQESEDRENRINSGRPTVEDYEVMINRENNFFE